MNLDVSNTYDVVVSVVRSGASLQAGMKRLIEHCSVLCPGDAWESISHLNFNADAAGLEQWLLELLQRDPPHDRVSAFWFGLFNGVNEHGPACILYVSGHGHYDPNNVDAWACADPVYVPEGRYAQSRVLAAMAQQLSDAASDINQLGTYVLELGYACLAVAQVRQSPEIAARLRGKPVVVGFDSGDFVTL